MRIRQIVMDMETQRDFFHPRGSCYTDEATGAFLRISRIFHWAGRQGIPVISTVLRVRPMEHGPLAEMPHCVEGTPGEMKMRGTILPSRVDLGLRNSTDLPPGIFSRYQQVIIERRNTDIFRHARLERLITEMPPAVYIICGAGLARGIFEAAVGLLSRGLGVVVASDAVLDLGDSFAGMARLRMEAKGAVFARTAEIVAPRAGRRPTAFRSTAAACR